MKKILFIEDEPELNIAYRKKFENIFDIDFATDSRTGLQKASDWQPNLVVLDILIPGELNGIEVLKELKSDVNTSYIPVLVLTNLEGRNRQF